MADGSINCKNDEYFDPHTGNCDPCKPICDISDCSRLCPNYVTTTSTTNNPVSEYDTNIILIICLVLVFISVVTTVAIVLYKRYRTSICTRLQYKTPEARTPVQATDDLLVSITLHN